MYICGQPAGRAGEMAWLGMPCNALAWLRFPSLRITSHRFTWLRFGSVQRSNEDHAVQKPWWQYRLL